MKKYLYYGSTLTIVLFVGFIGGVADIIQPQSVIDIAKHLGYPLYFFTLLGVFKVLGGIALLLPKNLARIQEVVYAGFGFDFIFAAYSHAMVSDPITKVIIPLVFLCVLGLSFYLRK